MAPPILAIICAKCIYDAWRLSPEYNIIIVECNGCILLSVLELQTKVHPKVIITEMVLLVESAY